MFLNFFKRLTPLIVVITSLIALLVGYQRESYVFLEITGELPYGFSIENFEEYLNTHVDRTLSYYQGLYVVLEKTQHYSSISIHRYKPGILRVVLERKKAIATVNDDMLLLEDASLVQLYGHITLPYHLIVQGADFHSLDVMVDIILCLKQFSIDRGVLSLGIFSDIILTTPYEHQLALPAHQPLQKLKLIATHFNGELPQKVQIDCRYEKGFILNKKQSARI